MLTQKLLIVIAIILRVVLWPLSYLSNKIFPPNELDGLTNTRSLDKAARAFHAHFQKLLQQSSSGVQYNPFESIGYQKCLREAQRSQQCVILYLHSPLHPQCDVFLKRYLVENTRFMTWLQENQSHAVACGVSINTPEGEYLSSNQKFGVSEFPALVVLGCRHSESTARNARNAGQVHPAHLEGSEEHSDLESARDGY